MKSLVAGVALLFAATSASAGDIRIDPGTNSGYCIAYVLNDMTTLSHDFFIQQQELITRAGLDAMVTFSQYYLPEVNDKETTELTYAAASRICSIMREAMLNTLKDYKVDPIEELPLPGSRK
jgi:hypothetical protein